MSATRYLQFALLLGTILSTTLLHGSDSETNVSNGKVVWTANFESNEVSSWSVSEVGGADGTVTVTNANGGGSNALQLIVANIGERCGVSFSDQSGFQIASNQWYDLTFRARTEKRENDRGYGLTVSLESRDGKQVCARTTIPEVGGEWRDYAVALHARLAHSNAALVISMSEPGTIWFDEITLTLRQTGREKQIP